MGRKADARAGRRQRARDAAALILWSGGLSPTGLERADAAHWSAHPADAADPEVRDYTRRLWRNALQHQTLIRAWVDRARSRADVVLPEPSGESPEARAWRCAFDIAASELLDAPDVPSRVAIAEALELVRLLASHGAADPTAAAAACKTALEKLSYELQRHAREWAFQVLFALDGNPPSFWDDAAATLSALADPLAVETPNVARRAESMAHGTLLDIARVDQTIQAVSRHWRLERMTRVDRNVLRIGVYELLHLQDVPARVIVSEAIELSKRFGTPDSGAFVNGLLDRIGHDTGRLRNEQR